MASVPRLIGISSNAVGNSSQHQPTCHPRETSEATVLFVIASLGILSNLALIALVICKKPLKRYRQSWSQGLLLHQAIVDLFRALLLIPLGVSVLLCQRLSRTISCSMIDTAFLLLVSVSTVNLLTLLINDAPLFPEQEMIGSMSAAVAGQRLRNPGHSWQTELSERENTDSPYCIVFGIFIIWFASLTINLGPTFLSGGLTSTDSGHIDVCPMVYRPVRHYVLNVLWISVNLFCVILMATHLRKIYRDVVKSNLEAVRLASLVTTMIPMQPEHDDTDQHHLHGYIQRLEREGLSRIRMFFVIVICYVLLWGPLFTVTLLKPGLESSGVYEVAIHAAFCQTFVTPILFMLMNKKPGGGDDEPDNGEPVNADQKSAVCCGCCDLRDEDEEEPEPIEYPSPPPPLELPAGAGFAGGSGLGGPSGVSQSRAFHTSHASTNHGYHNARM